MVAFRATASNHSLSPSKNARNLLFPPGIAFVHLTRKSFRRTKTPPQAPSADETPIPRYDRAHAKRFHRGIYLVTSSAIDVKRVFNFNAGPSALPLSVLERAREELLDWHGSGMSVMEMSHRSPEFESINAAAEAGLRKHLGIPDDYAVIFVQGGGSLQFSMVPMNLCCPGSRWT